MSVLWSRPWIWHIPEFHLWTMQATADAKKASTSKLDEKEDPSAGLMNVRTYLFVTYVS